MQWNFDAVYTTLNSRCKNICPEIEKVLLGIQEAPPLIMIKTDRDPEDIPLRNRDSQFEVLLLDKERIVEKFGDFRAEDGIIQGAGSGVVAVIPTICTLGNLSLMTGSPSLFRRKAGVAASG